MKKQDSDLTKKAIKQALRDEKKASREKIRELKRSEREKNRELQSITRIKVRGANLKKRGEKMQAEAWTTMSNKWRRPREKPRRMVRQRLKGATGEVKTLQGIDMMENPMPYVKGKKVKRRYDRKVTTPEGRRIGPADGRKRLKR